MSSLRKILKFASVLFSLAFGVFVGIVKFFAFLFADEETEPQISVPGMQIGETTLGTSEVVTINEDWQEVGAETGQPITRHI